MQALPGSKALTRRLSHTCEVNLKHGTGSSLRRCNWWKGSNACCCSCCSWSWLLSCRCHRDRRLFCNCRRIGLHFLRRRRLLPRSTRMYGVLTRAWHEGWLEYKTNMFLESAGRPAFAIRVGGYGLASALRFPSSRHHEIFCTERTGRVAAAKQ